MQAEMSEVSNDDLQRPITDNNKKDIHSCISIVLR